MRVNVELFETLRNLKAKMLVVLATDNMDCFTRTFDQALSHRDAWSLRIPCPAKVARAIAHPLWAEGDSEIDRRTAEALHIARDIIVRKSVLMWARVRKGLVIRRGAAAGLRRCSQPFRVNKRANPCKEIRLSACALARAEAGDRWIIGRNARHVACA